MIYLGNSPVGVALREGITSYVICIDNMFYYGNDTTHPKPEVPEKIVMDLPYCRSLTAAFSQYIANDNYSLNIKEVEIKLYHPVAATSFVRRNTKVERLVFPSGITLTANCTDFCLSATKLKSIVGKINFYNLAAQTMSDAFKCDSLEDIEFEYNCITKGFNFSSNALTDESIVSIANGLNEGTTGLSLTMTSTVKTKMQSMMGNVTVPTGQTYHIFTPDANGNTALSDFVTVTKGWTLA